VPPANKLRDKSHARIYYAWVILPTWRALSPIARTLLVEMLARYRPGDKGRASWSVRLAAEVLGVSKSTASRCLIELERNGWIAVATNGAFGGSPRPATYTLNMYNDEISGKLASRAFEHLPGERWSSPRRQNGSARSAQNNNVVPLAGRHGSI
jgi:hypothetical protein